MALTKQEIIELGLSNNPVYGDISQCSNLDKINDIQALYLSLGLGSDPEFDDISAVSNLHSYAPEQLIMVSLPYESF